MSHERYSRRLPAMPEVGGRTLLALGVTVTCVGGWFGLKYLEDTGFVLDLGSNGPTPQTTQSSKTELYTNTIEGHMPAVEAEWDCTTIQQGSNAYRAAMTAGNPEVVEQGPYRYVRNDGTVEIIDNLGQLDHRYNGGQHVYAGEQICVKQDQSQSSRLPAIQPIRDQITSSRQKSNWNSVTRRNLIINGRI